MRGKVPSTIRTLAREDAQTAAEYTVVLGLITLAIVTTFAVLSGSIQSVFELVTGVFS